MQRLAIQQFAISLCLFEERLIEHSAHSDLLQRIVMQCGRDADQRVSSPTHDAAACIGLSACDALPDSADGPAVRGIRQSREEPCQEHSAEVAGVAPAVARSEAEQMQTSRSETRSQDTSDQEGQCRLLQFEASKPVDLGLQDALDCAGPRQKSLQGLQEAVEHSQMKQECLRGLPEAAAPLEAQQTSLQALQEASEYSRACHNEQGSPADASAAPEQSAAGFRPSNGVLTELSRQPPAELESLPRKACCAGAGHLQPGTAHMPPAWQQARHSLSTAGLFVSAPAKRQRM